MKKLQDINKKNNFMFLLDLMDIKKHIVDYNHKIIIEVKNGMKD